MKTLSINHIIYFLSGNKAEKEATIRQICDNNIKPCKTGKIFGLPKFPHSSKAEAKQIPNSMKPFPDNHIINFLSGSKAAKNFLFNRPLFITFA